VPLPKRLPAAATLTKLQTGNVLGPHSFLTPGIAGFRAIVFNRTFARLTWHEHETTNNFSAQQLNKETWLVQAGDVTSKATELMKVFRAVKPGMKYGVVLELFLDTSKLAIPDSPYTRVWRDVMRHPVIPYELRKRKRLFKQAYEALADYFPAWENPVKGGWRERITNEIKGTRCRALRLRATHANPVSNHLMSSQAPRWLS
jgi:hypothetical protein